MLGSDRIFHLRCLNNINEGENSYQVWKDKLMHSINNSIGMQKELCLTIYNNNDMFSFWRFMRVTEDALTQQQAHIGDILLC